MAKKKIAQRTRRRTSVISNGGDKARISRAESPGAKTPKSTPSAAVSQAKTAAESPGAEGDLHRLGRIEEAAFTAQRELEDATDCIVGGYSGRDGSSAGDSLIDALQFLRQARRLLETIRRETAGEVTT
jgi:hypothetical protein